MSEEIKLSVVIPVYNVEKYLSECLDSIINQTLKELEIICVDDGSTDKCPEILQEYARKDSRITVITQPNKGVSTARNVGMQQAKGKYTTFIDPDDYIALNAFELLFNRAEAKNCDILLFANYCFTASACRDGGGLLELYNLINDNTTTFEEYPDELLRIPGATHGKFYRTDFLKRHNLRWNAQIQLGEDKVFFINTLVYAKSIAILLEHLYYYRVDTFNSLSKKICTGYEQNYRVYLALDKIVKNSKMKNADIIRVKILNQIMKGYTRFWKSIYNIPSPSNIKYLYKMAKDYKKVPKKYREYLEDYDDLLKTISDYRLFWIKKLFEPLIEIELRRNRIVVYLFEKQAIIIPNFGIIRAYLNIRYFMHLIKLRFCAKFRKIRVAFFVIEIPKWSSQASLYEALKKSPYFEPYVLFGKVGQFVTGISPEKYLHKGREFFESKGIQYEMAYDIKRGRSIELSKFKPDIIFYQQPWQMNKQHSLLGASNLALIAYTPYCYYSVDSHSNYLPEFHGRLWKYFVESESHKKGYEQKYRAKNCVAVGSCKLDSYKNIDKSKIDTIWKTDKKRIIYAPHNCFEKENADYVTATFDKNGDFILELAKSHPEFEWIFRPHPVFRDRVLRDKVKTLSEIENYYSEWEKIGTIYTGGDYYEMFAGSDCLITDCISFLSEYLPTTKPVIHLRKDEMGQGFNDIVKKITDSYYKVYDNETLERVFNEVVVMGNDYLKDKRVENIKLLIDENKTTGEKIKEYLEKELWLRG